MTDSTPLTLDPANEVHARALRRFETERIAWIATVGENGFPHAVPVWFVWHEGTVLFASEPGSVKVKNARRDARVLVHLDSGDDGEQLTVLQGTAELFADAASDWLGGPIGDAYLPKYADLLPALNLTPESMFARYSTVVRVTPLKLIAW